ncbi:hypothetical protein AB9K29_01610 [Phaeobacter italicus]|jgi:hypothetical protein|uniref:hypothetical protein n=1 Tax=Rhodobacterales TaxID=204455 RepID=UPI0035148D0A
MYEVFNVGKTLLLDGQPMSLVTPAGVEAWIDQGIGYSYRYDQVCDPLDGQMNIAASTRKMGLMCRSCWSTALAAATGG